MKIKLIFVVLIGLGCLALGFGIAKMLNKKDEEKSSEETTVKTVTTAEK